MPRPGALVAGGGGVCSPRRVGGSCQCGVLPGASGVCAGQLPASLLGPRGGAPLRVRFLFLGCFLLRTELGGCKLRF